MIVVPKGAERAIHVGGVGLARVGDTVGGTGEHAVQQRRYSWTDRGRKERKLVRVRMSRLVTWFHTFVSLSSCTLHYLTVHAPTRVRHSKVPLCGVAANQHGRCTRDGNFAVAHPPHTRYLTSPQRLC